MKVDSRAGSARGAELLAHEGLEALEYRYLPRQVSLEERYAKALPDVDLGPDPIAFAALAAVVREPKPPPTYGALMRSRGSGRNARRRKR